MLRWSLKRSVKRTWTNSAFSSNESAWSVMVTGPQALSPVALDLNYQVFLSLPKFHLGGGILFPVWEI